MKYGQIFHVMRIGKYYCKNMRYRINIYILNIQPIRVEYRYILYPAKVGIFPEAGGRGKYSLPRVQYMPIFHKEGF